MILAITITHLGKGGVHQPTEHLAVENSCCPFLSGYHPTVRSYGMRLRSRSIVIVISIEDERKGFWLFVWRRPVLLISFLGPSAWASSGLNLT
jgi:hypothetical protein